jgi:lipoate-protein ligase A
MEDWRFLEVETPDRAGMNLAIEEAIFLEKIQNRIPSTVRFWRNKRAVVIGYSQKVEAEVNVKLCGDEGIAIIRRFSGGGAVYHDLGNLNYSIILNADHPVVSGLDIRESYRVFSSGVVEGLRRFGVGPVLHPPSDLLVGKRKISGNAQSRKKGMVLHHGTLLVNSNLNLLAQVLDGSESGVDSGKTASRKGSVMNLVDAIGRRVDMREVKEALRRGFEKAFSIRLVQGMLTPEEEKSAHALYAEKYSRREWNFCL